MTRGLLSDQVSAVLHQRESSSAVDFHRLLIQLIVDYAQEQGFSMDEFNRIIIGEIIEKRLAPIFCLTVLFDSYSLLGSKRGLLNEVPIYCTTGGVKSLTYDPKRPFKFDLRTIHPMGRQVLRLHGVPPQLLGWKAGIGPTANLTYAMTRFRDFLLGKFEFRELGFHVMGFHAYSQARLASRSVNTRLTEVHPRGLDRLKTDKSGSGGSSKAKGKTGNGNGEAKGEAKGESDTDSDRRPAKRTSDR